MKLAIFSQDGDTQIVFTPESEWERSILAKIIDGNFELYRASFYECRGGWVRMAPGYKENSIYDPHRWKTEAKEDSSLIFRTKKPQGDTSNG